MKIMTIKINTSYPVFYSAIPMLASKDIDLKIIKSNSPFTLASVDSPDIVIHPMSFVMKDEFPEIKFVGPNCEFPNYEFTPEIGYTDWNINTIDPKNIDVELVFINTLSDMSFIKYLESLGLTLAIFGRQCDSLYYYGELEVDSYALYKAAEFIAVDNEAELLKAARTKDRAKPQIVCNFNNNICFNFKDTNKKYEYTTDILEHKNWDYIFKKLFKQIGSNYG